MMGNSDFLRVDQVRWGILGAIGWGILVALVGWVGWSRYGLSSQEGVANFAKAEDWFLAMREAGGLAWWSWSFQGGTSLAPMWGSFFSSVWVWVCVKFLGLEDGVKVAMLACVPLAAGGAGMLAGRLSGRGDVAAWAGLFYACVPSLWMRMMGVEHVVVVVAMAILPLTFWGLARLVQRPSLLSAVWSAVGCGMLVLSYSKVAVLAAPVGVCFVLWGLWKHFGVAGWVRTGAGVVFGVGVFLLGVVPMLPALREAGYAVLFEFGPMAGWQEAFAGKSALQWVDRLGWIAGQGFRADFAPTTGAGGFYLGAGVLFGIGVFLFMSGRGVGLGGRMAGVFRLCMGLGLVCFWLGHGPFSVFTGTVRAVELSEGAPDFFPALFWLSLIIQGWLLEQLVPRGMPLRRIFVFLACGVYFLLPGFRLLALLPIYAEVRAPFDFFQVVGPIWMCVAGAVGMGDLFGRWGDVRLRWAGGCVVIGLLGWDVLGNWVLGSKSALAAGTVRDFERAAVAMRDAKGSGSVYCLSGRYFYLLLPRLTGRPLVQEAFQSYLQQRGYAALQAAAMASVDAIMEYLRLAGVRFVVIDKGDPDLPVEHVSELCRRMEFFFRSETIDVLEVGGALAPGFGAERAILMVGEGLGGFASALRAAASGVVAIGPDLPGKSVGVIGADGRLEWDEAVEGRGSFRRLEGFLPVGMGQPGVVGGGQGEWSIVPLAWHPDVVAVCEGGRFGIWRAFGAFLAAEGRVGFVEFRHVAPVWYSMAIYFSGMAWVAAVGFLVVAGLVPRMGALWDGLPRLCADTCCIVAVVEGSDDEGSNGCGGVEPGKLLVVIPTYNEVETIGEVLRQIEEAVPGCHILVVDDGSPDGTAEQVQGNGRFGVNVFLMQRGGKKGLGTAYRDGFRWAMERGYEVVVEMDADLSHDPRDIPRLLRGLRGGVDAVVGSRYVSGLRVRNWPEYRLLISTLGTQFVKFFTGLPLSDATSGFKALKVEALRGLDLRRLRADGYGFQVELHYGLWRSGAKILELPITFVERAGGQTKMTVGIAWEAMWRVLQLSFDGRSWRVG